LVIPEDVSPNRPRPAAGSDGRPRRPQTAERLDDTAGGLRADLIARVTVFKNLGGGYVRHLAPGVKITTAL